MRTRSIIRVGVRLCMGSQQGFVVGRDRMEFRVVGVGEIQDSQDSQTPRVRAQLINFMVTNASAFLHYLNNIITKEIYRKTNILLETSNFKKMKIDLNKEASSIGFKKEFFKNSYTKKELPIYTLEKLQKYGINIEVVILNDYK